MTISEVEALGLGIAPVTSRVVLMVESALSWISDNTTLIVDPENMAAKAKLFIIKYIDVMSLSVGVSAESIEGLSQSYSSTDVGELLRQFASELFGEDYNHYGVHFIQAEKRWL